MPYGPPVTITNAEFQGHFDRYDELAQAGPVVITQDGRPTWVLLSADEYDRLGGAQPRGGGPNPG